MIMNFPNVGDLIFPDRSDKTKFYYVLSREHIVCDNPLNPLNSYYRYKLHYYPFNKTYNFDCNRALDNNDLWFFNPNCLIIRSL